MEPQHKKKKAPKRPLDGGRQPMTVAGQKYFAPEGRHSQQTHRIAKERADAAGQTEKEQHASDRAATLKTLADAADAMARSKEQGGRRI